MRISVLVTVLAFLLWIQGCRASEELVWPQHNETDSASDAEVNGVHEPQSALPSGRDPAQSQVAGYQEQRLKLIEYLKQDNNVLRSGYSEAFVYGEKYYDYPWLDQVLIWGEGTEDEALCLLYQISPESGRGGLSPWVLMVDDGGDAAFAYAGSGPRSKNFQLGDLDGDGREEILTHLDTGGNGGAGHYCSRLFQWDADARQLTTLYSGNVYEPDNKIGSIETHFKLRYENGFVYRITNPCTALDVIFLAEGRNYYFDEDGELYNTIEAKQLVCHEDFYDFHFADIDGDGVSEIITAEYQVLFWQSETCLLLSTLRYDRAANVFWETSSDVWYLNEDWKARDHYLYNWYK